MIDMTCHTDRYVSFHRFISFHASRIENLHTLIFTLYTVYSKYDTGSAEILVYSLVFKTNWEVRVTFGGFDSHTIPPSFYFLYFVTQIFTCLNDELDFLFIYRTKIE